MPFDEDTNDEAQLKRKLVEATESVRKKFKSIKSRHVEDKLELEKFHEPVMKPLQALSTLTKQNVTPTNAPGSEDNSVNTENNKINLVGAFPFGHLDSLLNTPSPSLASTSWEESGGDDYSYIIRSYMKGLKNAGKEFDPQYGVRIDPTTEKTYIGNVEIRFTDKEISLWDDNARIATFNGGPELYELIFLRLPQAALNSRIKTEDLQSYKNILIDSKAAYKDYNPRKGLKTTVRGNLLK
ncbi:hypothetical protein JTB14_031595 [Gonioctena quinquepunctata]|nr:hypothetical protein JTB14_031595 [Gonioctena quinquepunctata]